MFTQSILTLLKNSELFGVRKIKIRVGIFTIWDICIHENIVFISNSFKVAKTGKGDSNEQV